MYKKSISFARFHEIVDRSKALLDSGEESRASQIIRQGKNLRKEGETSFWDDFISICNDAQGLAELLNVSEQEVRNWPNLIKEKLDNLKKDQKNTLSLRDKINKEIIPTEGPSLTMGNG